MTRAVRSLTFVAVAVSISIPLLSRGRVLADPALPMAANLIVHTDRPGIAISPLLYGIFFEDINRSGDGGLYAEMIQNRLFEDNSALPIGWELMKQGNVTANMTLVTTNPLNSTNPTSLKLTLAGHGTAGISNQGYKGFPQFPRNPPDAWINQFQAAQNSPVNGLVVRTDEKYNLSFYVKADVGYTGSVIASLETQSGTALASQQFKDVPGTWQRFSASLVPHATDLDARLVLSIDRPGSVYFDVVSMFPANTFKHRPNGLRPDLAQLLVNMHPAFIRFPGGSFAEGYTLDNAFRWKQTIGDIAQRTPQWNIWGYLTSSGLGFHEYLQMCEDVGAEPLFVINCGIAEKDEVPVDLLEPWIEDALDAIEYANGPVTSKWGAERAKNGHPAPFNLKYIEIGNENGRSYPWGGGNGEEYLDRYKPFYDRIKAKYPEINLIANVNVGDEIDMVDEHEYSTPQWFIDHANEYDNYDRKLPKIYFGEYAVKDGAGSGNLEAALAEAAFMTGLERNSDVVKMSSYAPLFVNRSWQQWNPDAIVFDSSRAYETPSYYVQGLFASNKPDVILPTDVSYPPSLGGTTSDLSKSLFIVGGKYNQTGDITLKVVNVSGNDISTNIQLAGSQLTGVKCSASILTSSSPNDENSFETPTKVAPTFISVPVAGSSLTYTFPANSLTILRFSGNGGGS